MRVTMSFLSDMFGYIISVVVYLIYSLTWMLVSGIKKSLEPKREGYETSCKVSKIVWRRKFFTIDVTSPRDYITFNEQCTDPSYILPSTVSLYCVSKDYVYFVKTMDHTNVYSMDVNPFLFIGQFEHAVKLIKLPVSSFIKIAEKIGDPLVKLCFVANTGRCGSTLLAKALDNVPGTLVQSEPDCFTNLGYLWKQKYVTQSEYEELLVATIRVLCKPRQGIERVVIKVRVCGTCHTETIYKYFPEATILFGYRNSFKTIYSFLAVLRSGTALNLAISLIDSETASTMCPWFRRKLLYYYCYMLENLDYTANPDSMNSVEQFAYTWAHCIKRMKTFKQRGGVFTPIRYEDLVANKLETLKDVFKAVGIDERYIEYALKAFSADSQAGSPVSRQHQTNIEIDCKNISKANVIMRKFGLPNVEENISLSE